MQTLKRTIHNCLGSRPESPNVVRRFVWHNVAWLIVMTQMTWMTTMTRMTQMTQST